MSGRSAVGSALALGARGRQFESDRPDHFLPKSHFSEIILLSRLSARVARLAHPELVEGWRTSSTGITW